MSHLIASEVCITDLDILRKAVAGFTGLVWNDGATTFKSYYSAERLQEQINAIGTCEHSISITKGGGYQIGVIRKKDGTGWSLAFDPYDTRAAAIVGRNSEMVMNQYSETFIRDWAEKTGFMVEHSVDAEGNTQLSMTSAT